MQQFTVPQFIEVESKIIGPVTARQFVIVLAAGLFCALLYRLFDFTTFAFLSFIILVAACTFAFVKINGMPFHFFALNILQTLRSPRLRVWRVANDVFIEKDYAVKSLTTPPPTHYTTSRLNQLALIVDTAGGYSGEGEEDEVRALKK